MDTGQHIKILLIDIISQLNNNNDLYAMCISCIFPKIVEWLPFMYSECSKKCGGGKKKGVRGCNSNQIEDCKKYIGGKEEEIIDCNVEKCEWIEDGYWTECSKKCGGGEMHRYLKCSSGNNDDCDGKNYETKECNLGKCVWKPLGPWTECSKQCGGGTQVRYLKCSSGDGNDCDGDSFQTKQCNQRKCKWITIAEWTGWKEIPGTRDRIVFFLDIHHAQFRRRRYRYCETGNNNDCEGLDYIEETKSDRV
eukprot:351111_1